MGALLADDGRVINVEQLESRVAPLTNRRSRQVSVDLALQILERFLPALGVVSLPGIETVLAGATRVAFTFDDVTRRYVEVTGLGKALAGRRLDPANPATTIFLEQRYELLVVDSVLVSRSFSVEADHERDVGFRVNANALEQLLEVRAGATVRTRNGRDIVFIGPAPVTFAFSCVRFIVGDDGTLASIEPHGGPRSLGFDDHTTVLATPDRVLLTREPELVEWDVD